MKAISAVRILAVFILFLGYATDSTADSCEEPDQLLPQATLILKHAAKDKNGIYFGDFELVNHRITPEITIPGRKANEAFYVDYPDVYVQFKDLNGTWVTLMNHAPGSFGPSPNELKVAIHSKALFRADLFSIDFGDLSGTDFRLIVRFSKTRECITSAPFRAYPNRRAITIIKSLNNLR